MSSDSRKGVRFKPQPGTLIAIDFDCSRESFVSEAFGLPIDESYRGVGFVIVKSPPLKIGDSLKVKIGHLLPMRAKVVWEKVLDQDIQRVGLEFDKDPVES